MERRDLIQDQIDQLGAILAKMLTKILGLKSQGFANECIQVVNQDLKDSCEIDDVLALSVTEFILILEKNPNFNSINLEKSANNLFLIAKDLDVVESKDLYQKSLKILQLVNNKELTYSHERFIKMKNIERILSQSEIN